LSVYPPRIPPTGFLGLGATPTCVGASARRVLVDDSDRVCVGRAAFRAINVKLRADVEAILAFSVADFVPRPSRSTRSVCRISQHVTRRAVRLRSVVGLGAISGG
jgi:hypothetical protein